MTIKSIFKYAYYKYVDTNNKPCYNKKEEKLFKKLFYGEENDGDDYLGYVMDYKFIENDLKYFKENINNFSKSLILFHYNNICLKQLDNVVNIYFEKCRKLLFYKLLLIY